ncbi:MAG: SANT/Myb domain-containing protein [Holosporales bacterium]|jgi:hypothetical protein|nr:SANT/Myb domain-containing protein [Holosporales bacterium]
MKHFLMHAFAVLLLCNYNSELNSSGNGDQGQYEVYIVSGNSGWGDPVFPYPQIYIPVPQFTYCSAMQTHFHSRARGDSMQNAVQEEDLHLMAFSLEEDLRLMELVNIYGIENWYEISRQMNNRSAIACVGRYSYILKRLRSIDQP